MKSKVPIPNGILYLAIVLVNCIVYFPALGHVGRADQIIYLIDTAKFNNDSLPAFILKTYSYPRSREINTGDEILFRPVLFIFLAIEKWFFGYNFVWWQALGIILHLALLWQAIRIMCLVSENPFSFLFVLSFSVLFVSQEMVIWHAINGYLLCLIFVAGAFYHLIKLLQSDLNDDKQLPFIVGFLTMACFTYEFGLVCAMIFSLMVLAKKYLMRDRESRMRSLRQFPELIIAFPVLIYIAVSSVDYLLRLGWHLPGMYKTPPVSAAQAFLSLILDFFQSVFLPAFLMITANERSSIDTLPWHNILLSRGPHGFWQTFNWFFFLRLSLRVFISCMMR